MVKIPAVVKKEFDSLVPNIAEALTALLGKPVLIDIENAELCPAEDFLRKSRGGGFCCRSQCLLPSSGTLGLFIQDRAAQVISALTMFMDVPEEGTPLDSGDAQEALDEIFNVVLGTWNRLASAEFRMSTKPKERSVERYYGLKTFPENSGVFPVMLSIQISIDGIKSDLALFLPLKYCSHLSHSPFKNPEIFQVQSFFDADAVEIEELEEDVETEKGTPPAAPAKKRAPGSARLMIVNDAQVITEIIRERTAAGDWELVRDEPPESNGDNPSCVIVFGDVPELYKKLDPAHLVHVRAKSKDPA